MKKASTFLLVAFLMLAINFSAKAQISGTVFKDFDNDGLFDNIATTFPYEKGAANVVVNVYNTANVLLATATTSPTGAYSFTVGAVPAGNYRIEFITPTGLQNGKGSNTAAASSNTDIQFITAPATTVNYGVASGEWYVTNNNPFIATNVISAGNPTGGGTSGTRDNLFVMPYSLPATGAAGVFDPAQAQREAHSTLGSVFGLTYQKSTNTLLNSAYYKRHVAFGPSGIDAIYKTQVTAGNPAVPSLLVKLSTIGINVGIDTRSTIVGNPNYIPPASNGPSQDQAAFANIGKRGIGDIDLSEDGKNLFVVNLFENKLHRINVGAPLKTSFVAADVTTWAIPNPTGLGSLTWHPFGLKTAYGKVYVGGVMVKEQTTNHSLADTAGQRGIVYELDPANGVFTEVLRFPLTYRRGFGNSDTRFPFRNNYWCAWQNNGDGSATGTLQNGYNTGFGTFNGGTTYPQPMLADIEFTDDNQMLIGMRDRFGDQMGYQQPDINGFPGAAGFGAAGIQYRALASGDNLIAGKNLAGAGWTLENRGQVTNYGVTNGTLDGIYPVGTQIITTTTNWTTNTGTPYGIGSTGTSGAYGPGSGFGVSAYTSPGGPAPGNNQGGYYLNNHNFSANAANSGENGLDGAVTLNGAATAITAHFNKGDGGMALVHGSNEYIFTMMDPVNATFTSGLERMVVNTNGAAVNGNMVQRLELTSFVANDPSNMGKANAMGDVEVLTPYQPIEVGNRIWEDTNADGVQGAGEIGINGVAVELVSPGIDGIFGNGDDVIVATTTTATIAGQQGSYYFNTLTTEDTRKATANLAGVPALNILPGFDYQVRIVNAVGSSKQAALATYQPSSSNVLSNGLDKIDNDGIISGNNAVVTFNTNDNNHSFDFGFNKLASLGNKVWRDENRNGIQDPGEPGVAGIPVALYQNGSDGIQNDNDIPVGYTVTDANGNYFFDNLQPSNNDATKYYSVGFTLPPNYTWTTQTNTQTAAGVSNAATGGSTNANGNDVDALGFTGVYNLQPGQSYLDADAGIVVNQTIPTSSIGNRVWFDADGDGLQDASEQGLSDVTVALYDNAGNVIAITKTNANGEYLFADLPNGTYKVRVTPFPRTKFSPTTGTTPGNNTDSDVNNTPNTLNYGFSSNIVISALGTVITGIDAGLTNDTRNSLGDFVWIDEARTGGATTQNSIQDGEQGVPGLTMYLYNASNVLVGTTTTDAFGVYLFSDLPDGQYRVGTTVPAGYSAVTPNVGANDASDSDFDPIAIGASTHTSPLVTLADANGLRTNTTIDFGIINNNTASLNRFGDRVWLDLNADGLQTAGEPGVINVTVRLFNAAGTVAINNPATGLPYVVRSSRSGAYYFYDLPDGNYSVKFDNLPENHRITAQDQGVNGTNALGGSTATGSATESAVDSDVNPATAFSGVINLDAAGSLSTRVDEPKVDMGLIVGTSNRKGSIGDKVFWDLNGNNIQDADEAGVGNIQVRLYKNANPTVDNDFADAILVATTFTDALGKYNFGNLDEGEYQVVFGAATLVDGGFPTGTTLSTKDIGGNDVIDSDGNALGSAIAGNTLTPAGRSFTDLIVLAQGENKATVDQGIIPAANTNTLGDIVFWDNGQAGGTAKDGIQNGTEPGVAGVQVTLYTGAGAVYDRDPVTAGIQPYIVTTDENGKYKFVNLPDGTYKTLFSNFPAGFSLTGTDKSTEASGTDSDPSQLDGLTIESWTLGVSNRNELKADAGLVSDKAALGDKVFDDLNNNGIQDVGEPGVSGVAVTLYAADGTTKIASAITDANGKYYFQNLDPATYVVGFSELPAGKSFTQQITPGDNGNNTNSDANIATGKTAPITLIAGENDLTIDAGISSQLLARVGDLVWLDVNRDGVYNPATEVGVPGVLVTLYNSSNQAIGTAITDGRGNYSITNVAPGTGYYIGFSNLPDNFAYTTRTNNVSLTDATLGSDPDPATGLTASFNLAAGDNNPNVDAGLILPAELGDFVWLDTDKDGIQGAGEPGVSGVSVTLYKNGPDGLPGTADDVQVSTTVTDSYGKYLFPKLSPTVTSDNTTMYNVQFGLPPNYQFTTQTNTQTAAAGNYTTTTTGGSTDLNGSDVTTSGSLTGRTGSFSLAAGTSYLGVDAGIIFQTPAVTPATSSIGDKVWLENGTPNGTLDAGEFGLSGISVTLYKKNGAVYDVYQSTITDGTGMYMFNNLPNGDYQVKVTPAPGTLITTGGTLSTGNATNNSDVSNTPGANYGRTTDITIAAPNTVITGVDAGLYLQPSNKAALGNRVWVDANKNGIQDEGEMGIPNIIVELYTGTLAAGPTGAAIATTTTDGNGYYIFNDLAPTVGTGTGYFVKFPTAATINNGATSLQLTTVDASGNSLDETDSDPKVTAVGPIGAGYTEGYVLSPGQRNMTVDAGYYNAGANTASLGNRVWNDANDNGIQDAGEVGVPGVRVILRDNTNAIIATQSTDANGDYLFSELPAGTYTVEFDGIPTGFSISAQDAGANDGVDNDVNFITRRTAPISLAAGEANTTVDAGITKLKPSGLASIGNRVWYDINGNGVQDDNETGVRGVQVNLYKDVNNNGTIDAGEQTPTATLYTNALGEYLFGGLPQGAYQVGFNFATAKNADPLVPNVTVVNNGGNAPAAGTNYALTGKYLPSGAGDPLNSFGNPINTAVAGNPAAVNTSFSDLINLREGEEKLPVDVGIIPPSNRNTLGNFVWLDVNKNGIQDAGEPGVTGVTVSLISNSGATAGQVLATTTTNSKGEYQFANLPDGDYSVSFTALPAGTVLTQKSGSNDATGSDASLGSGKTDAVTLGAGNRNDNTLDAGLISTRAALGNYVWQDLNYDGKQDAGEPGVSGVTVVLFRPGFGLDGIAGNGDDALPVSSMITDANGQYLFTNLQPGTYQVEFSTIPTGSIFTKNIGAGDNKDNTNNDAIPATFSATTARTVNIVLSAEEVDLTVDAGIANPLPASIGSKVWLDANNDGLYTTDEKGVPGALVTLKDNLGNVVATTITDGDGNWVINNIPAGTGYTVTFAPNIENFGTITNVANPLNPQFTTSNVGANGTNGLASGTESEVDSDVPASGITAPFDIAYGNNFPNIDAGIISYILVQVLPVKYTAFTAKPRNNEVVLEWSVAEQINVNNYVVETSTDGSVFNKIATVIANINSSASYDALHTNPNIGINFYRIKAVDNDGKFSYSEIRKVTFGKAGDVIIYPNPVTTGVINVTLTGSMINKSATVSIISMDGKLISQQQIANTNQTETIDVSKLASGSYIVRLITKAEVVNKTIQVIR
jgi:SdrD B-like domain/Secretion system C-terminal sorting domain